MKRMQIILLLCVLTITNICAETWDIVIENKLTSISVEKALYKKSGDNYFYLRFKIKNKADSILGIDLTKRPLCFYPNQWLESNESYRAFISERISIPEIINTAMKDKINKSFKNKTLQIIGPRSELDYYISFNNPIDNARIDNGNKKNIIISIKGQLLLSNGSDVWDEKASSELCLVKPIEWRVINVDGIIIN